MGSHCNWQRPWASGEFCHPPQRCRQFRDAVLHVGAIEDAKMPLWKIAQQYKLADNFV